MLEEGPDSEIHPAILLVSKWFGPIVGPMLGVVGKAAAGIVVAIYCRRFAIHILLVASILSLWAAWYNLWGHKIYSPLIFKLIFW